MLWRNVWWVYLCCHGNDFLYHCKQLLWWSFIFICRLLRNRTMLVPSKARKRMQLQQKAVSVDPILRGFMIVLWLLMRRQLWSQETLTSDYTNTSMSKVLRNLYTYWTLCQSTYLQFIFVFNLSSIICQNKGQDQMSISS